MYSEIHNGVVEIQDDRKSATVLRKSGRREASASDGLPLPSGSRSVEKFAVGAEPNGISEMQDIVRFALSRSAL